MNDTFDKAAAEAIKANDGPAERLAQLYEEFSSQVLARATTDLIQLNQLAAIADVVAQKTERLVKIMAAQVADLGRANAKPTPSVKAVAAKFAPVDDDGDIEQGNNAGGSGFDHSANHVAQVFSPGGIAERDKSSGHGETM